MSLTLTDLLTTFGPTDALAATLQRAERYARDQQHRALSLEHLLLALSEDPDASVVLTGCSVDLMRLKVDVSSYLGRLDDRVEDTDGARQQPVLSDDLVRIFKVAHAAAGQKQRAPTGGLVLAAIVGDGRSPAANMLRVQGLTFDAAVQALQSANAQLRAQKPVPALAPPTTQVPSAPPATASVQAPTAAPRAPAAAETTPRTAPPTAPAALAPVANVTSPPTEARGAGPAPQPTTPPQPTTAPPARPAAPPPPAPAVANGRAAPPQPTLPQQVQPRGDMRAILDDARRRIDAQKALPGPKTPAATADRLARLDKPPRPRGQTSSPQPHASASAPTRGLNGAHPGSAANRPAALPAPPAPSPSSAAPKQPIRAPAAPAAPRAPNAISSGDRARLNGAPPPGRAEHERHPHQQLPVSSGLPAPPRQQSPHAVPGARAPAATPQQGRAGSPSGGGSSGRQQQPVGLPHPASSAPGVPPPRTAPLRDRLLMPPQRPEVTQQPPPHRAPAPQAGHGTGLPPPQHGAAPGPNPSGPNAPQLTDPRALAPPPRGPAHPQQRPAPQRMPPNAHPPVQAARPPGPRAAANRAAAPFAKGDLARAVPGKMQVGEAELIEVRIARQDIELLNGAPSAHANGQPRRDFVVSRAMTLRMRAPTSAFTIEPGAPETQWIENRLGLLNDEYVIWRWTVTPKERGTHGVQIIGNLRAVTADGLATETALPDEHIDIAVRPKAQRAAGRIALWTCAMGIGAVLAVAAPIIWPSVRQLAGL